MVELLKAELLVVVEEVDEGDPAVDGGPHHAPQVRPLKVGPHDLVKLPVAQHLQHQIAVTRHANASS
jgi:hypothetical protein